MKRPIAIDLFCGGGGASMGLYRAGFDVRGVDIKPQPEYPFPFTQGDALEADLSGADFVWASPPCQAHSSATRNDRRHRHPDLIPATRSKLESWGGLWVMENVVGAPLANPLLLCGAMFGLRVIRHRLFEASFFMLAPTHPEHHGGVLTGEYVTVAGNGGGHRPRSLERREALGLPRHIPGEFRKSTWQAAMGIDWMSRATLTQAIPPAYAEWIGRRAIAYLTGQAVSSGP